MSREMPAAGHCGHCREPLPDDAVSAYYCSQGHQDLWYMARVAPIGSRSGKPHLTWDQQAAQIRVTMTGMREAFTAFGKASRRVGEAPNHLTDAAQ